MADDELWMKRGSATWGLGIPTIIMTVGKSGQHYVWGEFFVLISGRVPAFFSQRTNFDIAKIPRDLIEEYSEFMRKEIEQQVQTRLSLYYFDLYEKTKNDFYLQRIDLVDVEKEDIIRLWMRGEFHDEIKKIKETTQSDPLRSFLTDVGHLSPIFLIK